MSSTQNTRYTPYGNEAEAPAAQTNAEAPAAQANAEAPAQGAAPPDAELLAARIAEATPAPQQQKQRFVDWRTTTKEALKQCLSFSDPKTMDMGAKIAFCNFDLNKWCEIFNLPRQIMDLHGSGNDHFTIMGPLMKMPFGPNNFVDPQTGASKWSVLFSFYSAENQAEVDEFDNFWDLWIDAITEIIVECGAAEKFGEDMSDGPEMAKKFLKKSYETARKEPKKADYKRQLNVKIKSSKGADVPILKIWDEQTRKQKVREQVVGGDYGRPIMYFEGITKVQGKYYERWFTREITATDSDSAVLENNTDDTCPLEGPIYGVPTPANTEAPATPEVPVQ